jgi:Holliday junction resolvase RusA-like endonuclease
MCDITFSVVGKPHGKQRPRMSRRGRKTITYTPQATVDYERSLREGFLLAAMKQQLPLTGLIAIEVVALFPRTQALSFQYKDGTYKHPMGRLMMGVKPDGDNVMKCVWDAVGDYIEKGDSRVVYGNVLKLYCAIDENPGTFVRVKNVESVSDLGGLIDINWTSSAVD